MYESVTNTKIQDFCFNSRKRKTITIKYIAYFDDNSKIKFTHGQNENKIKTKPKAGSKTSHRVKYTRGNNDAY